MLVDIGCGSGAWVLEVGDKFTKTRVIGTDLSPIQPVEDLPDNVEFIVSDMTEGLPFNDGSTDLVHSR